MRTLLALALLLPITAHAAESVTVGRLFFTPEQRAQLDALRIKKVIATQTKDEPAPEVVTYNGIVRRSDGKATVWVNNKALTEGELSTAESVSGRISRDGQILLGGPAPGAGKMQLKVGQSAELLSGRVGESYSVLQNTQAPGGKPKPTSKTETNSQAESTPAIRQPLTKDGGEDSARPAVREAVSSRERASDATAK